MTDETQYAVENNNLVEGKFLWCAWSLFHTSSSRAIITHAHKKLNFFNLVHVVGQSVYLLSTTLLNWSVSCNGTQRHGGEHGAEEGDENDEERLPHPGISHDVEETQKNKHTCEETDWSSYFQTFLKVLRRTLNPYTLLDLLRVKCDFTDIIFWYRNRIENEAVIKPYLQLSTSFLYTI